HVQRKAMGRYPARDMYSYRSNFSTRRVNARQSRNAKRFNVEVAHRANQNFFQVAHVAMHVFTIGTEIDNRIADDLAQSMISHFAAAIRFEHSHAARLQKFIIRDDRARRRTSAQRQRVRMFEQKQRVRLFIRQNRELGLSLDIERSRVFNSSQTFDFQNSLSHAGSEPPAIAGGHFHQDCSSAMLPSLTVGLLTRSRVDREP